MHAVCDARFERSLAPMRLEDTCFFCHCPLHYTSITVTLRDQPRRASMSEIYNSAKWNVAPAI